MPGGVGNGYVHCSRTARAVFGFMDTAPRLCNATDRGLYQKSRRINGDCLGCGHSILRSQGMKMDLSVDEVVGALERAGFRLIPLTGNKVIRLTHPAYSETVYVKRGASQYITSPLVLHPLHAPKLRELANIPGVELSSDPYYHNSNLRGFPRRVRNGATPINYGIAIGLRDTAAMTALLVSILGEELAVSADRTVTPQEAPSIDLSEIAQTDTERDALIKARIGQGRYRDGLLAYWGGCSVTECSVPQLLRASHIKPWRAASHKERLDHFNGLLLTPNLDLAFDQGLISFNDQGDILLSSEVDVATAKALHLSADLRLRQIEPSHRGYLAWHRENLFQG